MTTLVWGQVSLAPALVEGTDDCPAPSAIDAKVREILGLGANVALAERASLRRQAASLYVTLKGGDLRILGERVLPADGSCDEQAAAVAVLLAAWLSDVHPEFVSALPTLPAVEESESALPAPPPATPAPPPSAPAPSPRRLDGSAPPSGRRPGDARSAELSAAAGAAVSGEAVVPLAALSARYLATAAFGGVLTATLEAPRRVRLSSGSARYFRWPLVVAPALRVSLGLTRLDLSAGPAGAWLHISGEGFQPSSSHDALVLGGTASGRLAWPQGRIAPFIELSATVFQSAEAYVHRDAEEPSVALSSFELYLALGGALRVF